MFLSRGDRDLGVAFQTHLVSQALSRGEAKDSILLSSRDAGLLEPPERPQGCNSRIPWQLEKNNVVPLSSKYEAPVSYSVSRVDEDSCSSMV